MQTPPKDLKKFESLLDIMSSLRSKHGCPWDKEQNHQSLVPYAIEEVYELAEAIETGDTAHMVEELGDVLFQVAFHAQLGQERGAFSIDDILLALNEKMVRRHPHVFGDVTALSSEDVLKNWDQIKKAEKSAKAGSPNRVADIFNFDIPLQLPALDRANKIGVKTARRKFDWTTAEQVLLKLEEEIAELKEAMQSGNVIEIEHELGDVLFTTAQLGRHLHVNPEQTLRECNRRFEHRCRLMQEILNEQGLNWDNLEDPSKEKLWQAAKKRESK